MSKVANRTEDVPKMLVEIICHNPSMILGNAKKDRFSGSTPRAILM